MNANSERTTAAAVRPPQIIPSLVGGFNAVASNIHLIIIPVLLDLLLWFGPHLRLKALMEPALLNLLDFVRRTSSQEMSQMVDSMQSVWLIFLERFNLASLLSTYPLGVPALMAATSPAENPLGGPPVFELGSFGIALLSWLALTLLGYGLGAVYFSTIAQVFSGRDNQPDCLTTSLPGHSAGKVPPMRLGVLAWQAFQLVALVLILLILLALLMIPALLVSSFLALFSPIIAQLALLLFSFGLVWLLVPLIFSPHGIFLCGQSVLNAMLNSARVVRFSLSGTGLFLLVGVILYQGMGVLWRVPPDRSWMALVGIAGHAFISTGLLAASFFYYRSGLAYLQSLRKIAFDRGQAI